MPAPMRAGRVGPRSRGLTSRGWVLLCTALVSLGSARVFAIIELAVVGVAILLLLAGALCYQAVVRPTGTISRELHPPRVYAGAASRIDLQVENRSRRTTPVLALQDPVSGTRGASLLVQPLRPGASTRAAYQLPTSRRGVLRVGPLAVSITDPFGLTTRSEEAVDAVELTVFPRVDVISPAPLSSGHDPMSGADHPNALGRTGEDFYALRPYVIGDDLRRVHWRSSARTDDLLVRQDELPWHGRTTVIVDVRLDRHTEASFEAVVSAAASIVMASTRRDDLVRLATTEGWESTASSGLAHADHILEHLANLAAPGTDARWRGPDSDSGAPGARLTDALDLILRTASGGAAVILTPTAGADDDDALSRLQRRFGSFHLVTFETEQDGRSGTRTAADRPIDGRITVAAGQSFPQIWNEVVRPGTNPSPAIARGAPGARVR